MLKEVLNIVLMALPNWLILLLEVLDRYEKRKNKRADDVREK